MREGRDRGLLPALLPPSSLPSPPSPTIPLPPTTFRTIIETPGLVDAIRNILSTTESPKTKEVAKGALWTLGEAVDPRGGCLVRHWLTVGLL